jgi:hypothetical protein
MMNNPKGIARGRILVALLRSLATFRLDRTLETAAACKPSWVSVFHDCQNSEFLCLLSRETCPRFPKADRDVWRRPLSVDGSGGNPFQAADEASDRALYHRVSLVIFGLAATERASGIKVARPLVVLGEASYALYLVHPLSRLCSDREAGASGYSGLPPHGLRVGCSRDLDPRCI